MDKKRKIKILEYNAVFASENEGGFSVSVPDLPGCFSQGDTFEEAEKNITEAIELYLEDADAQLYHVTPDEARKRFVASISVRINV